MVKFKRQISMVLLAFMLVTSLPLGDIVALAQGEDDFKIEKIVIYKNYKNFTAPDNYNIRVQGSGFLYQNGNLKLEVGVPGSDGKINLFNPDIKSNTIVQYQDIKGSEISGELIIQGVSIDIDTDFPEVSKAEPANRFVDSNEGKFILEGSNFDLINNGSGIKGFLFQGTSEPEIKVGDGTSIEAGKIESNMLKGKTGSWGVGFSQKSKIDKENSILNQVELEKQHRYERVFTAITDLAVGELVEVSPTRGPLGSQANLKSNQLLQEDQMSVFLVKSLDEKITLDHMSKYEKYRASEEEDIFTFEIPESLRKVYGDNVIGDYYIILTNNIESSENPEEKMTSMRVLKQKFTVVDGSDSMKLNAISPNEGSAAGGSRAIVSGRYIASMSPSAHRPPSSADKIKVEIDGTDLVITYTDGEYLPLGPVATNKIIKYKTLQRRIKMQVGMPVIFDNYSVENTNLNPNGLDSIGIIIPPMSDLENPLKSLGVEVETTMTYENQEENESQASEKVIKFTESDILVDAFLYLPINYIPEIESVVPDRIPVDDRGKIDPDGIELTITGENFVLHRYTDEEGKLRYKYPIIDLAGIEAGKGDITLNKNDEGPYSNPDLKLKIYDKDGREIDGRKNSNKGVKIVVTLPDNQNINLSKIGTRQDLLVTNPIINSEPLEKKTEDGQPQLDPNGNPIFDNLGSPGGRYDISFVKIKPNEVPIINEIDPSVVTVNGYEGAEIRGSNFDRNVKVYLDGEEIEGVERNEIGTKLTLDLPAKLEGRYTVLVQNESGGIALIPVEYVKSETRIKINDFNPKKGSAGTIVTVKGSGFLRPVNSKISNLDNIAISRRLIGTTVLLGGEDVNEYNLDREGKIELINFTPEEDIIQLSDEGALKLVDYYRSLIFEDESEPREYYSLYYDSRDGNYKLSDSRNEYLLGVSGTSIIAKNKGKEYKLITGGNKLTLRRNGEADKTLNIKTPYTVENGRIVGNRVKVLSENELIFEVPPKSREGYYDLSLVNPDTNRDSKLGEKGFYYAYQPDYNPEIEEIRPNEGAVDGGYFIDIIAKEDSSMFKGFVDNGGDNKTSVIIGGVVVDPKNVEVASDGYKIKVLVPAYPGDLSKETDLDRKSVTVVVVNPDGGSDSLEDGFTYVIPISQPKISNIFKKEGQAAGGNIVTIEGSQFRYFEPFSDNNKNTVWDEGEEYRDLNKNDKFDDLRTGKVWVGEKDQVTGKYTINQKLKEIDQLTDEEWDIFVKPILPKIYFSGNLAKIIDFEAGKIDVEVPQGIQGDAKVYLVNNDYGRSNELIYKYEVSKPSIERVAPNIGSKEGGQDIQILGSNFMESQVNIIKDSNSKRRASIQLVQFGDINDENISNQKFQRGDIDENGFDNSGKIEYRQAEVRVGDLKVEYNAKDSSNKTLDFSIVEGVGEDKKEYSFSYNNWDEEEIFLPIGLLESQERGPDGNYENYPASELVRIVLETIEGAQSTRRLRVDRGFAPEARLKNSNHIELKNPSYYSVGSTKLTVINPDKMEASSTFNYRNPATNPKITNILNNGEDSEKVNGKKLISIPYTGGNTLKIEGVDFRKPAEIILGGQIVIPQDRIEYYPEGSNAVDYIVVKMDRVDEKYVNREMNVTLTNSDGGSDTTKDIFIKFTRPETLDMEIKGIVPNQGPTRGGTEVVIHGKDFRESMPSFPKARLKVFFEKDGDIKEVPREDIISISYDKIVLRTPAFTAGTANVKVVNPDTNSVTLLDGFTYTSEPRIQSIVDPEDEELIVNNISFKGGERIKIKGSDFLEGARVLFNPKLRELGEDENPTGEIIVIEGKRYLLESFEEGLDVELVNKQNILVTTPAGKLGDKGVLVVNPDGGVSNLYNLEYGLPEVGAPFNVRAELVYDEYIRVSWTGVRNALEYEIYVSEDGSSFEYAGSTKLTSFAYKKIKPRTEYVFMVRALGEYGPSKPLDESKSNKVETNRIAGPEDLDGALAEETVVNRQGERADIVIGSKDLSSQTMTFNLLEGELAGVKDISIRIPAKHIASNLARINIIGQDYNMSFSPGVFNSEKIAANINNPKAGVVFKVERYNGDRNILQGRMPASPRYILSGERYIGQERTALERLNGGIDLNLVENTLLSQGRKLADLGLTRYSPATNNWIKTQKVDRMAIYSITGINSRRGVR